MNLDELIEYCLGKEDVEESFPFGPDTMVFKLKGKVFLLVGLDNDPLRMNVKCDPEKAIELREQFSCVISGYHMNKKHWNTIILDGTVSDNMIKEWIDHSYNLINSIKKTKIRA